jgi:hypothetical protein
MVSDEFFIHINQNIDFLISVKLAQNGKVSRLDF